MDLKVLYVSLIFAHGIERWEEGVEVEGASANSLRLLQTEREKKQEPPPSRLRGLGGRSLSARLANSFFVFAGTDPKLFVMWLDQRKLKIVSGLDVYLARISFGMFRQGFFRFLWEAR